MDEISAICPVCDTNAVLSVAAIVLVADEPEEGSSRAGWAMWRCDRCNDWTAAAVGRRQFTALQALGGHLDGADHSAWPPPRVDERPQRKELTFDDLIDFHELLEQPDWFAQLLRFSGAHEK